MMKRLLSVMICVVMVCLNLPLTVTATENSEVQADFLFFECEGLETTIIPQGESVGVARLSNSSDADAAVFAKTVVYNTSGAVLAETEQVLWNVLANTTNEYKTKGISCENMINLSHIELSVWTVLNGENNVIGTKKIYVNPVIVDDSTDGILNWMGYQWSAGCIPENLPSDRIYSTEPCQHGWMYVDDNNYMNFQLSADYNKGMFHRIEIPRSENPENDQIDLASNYDFEFDMKVIDFGEYLGFQMFDENYRAYFVLSTEGILYETSSGSLQKNVAIGYDWNTFRGEKRGNTFTFYMNGEVMASFELPRYATADYRNGAIRFYGTLMKINAPKFQLRRAELTQYEDVVEMVPDYDSVYESGENIEFKAEVPDSPQRVDYYVGDVKIGSATAEDDYTYILEDARTGSYNVSAKVYYADGSEKYTFRRVITVKGGKEVLIDCPDTVNYGDTVGLSVNGQNADFVRAEFYVNGVCVGSSEDGTLELKSPKIGTSSVFARVYFEDGSNIQSDTAFLNVKASVNAGALEVGQEYDISYNFGGGSGSVSLKDGLFELNMSHSQGGVTYKTRDGEEFYSAPSGKYRAVVTAGIADVYRDGQFAFSYYMPNCTEISELSYSGVSGVELGGSGVKAELFRMDTNGKREVNAEDINMSLYYSLEFDKKDASGETIHLYDGEYELSVKFNGGITVLEQARTERESVEKKLISSVIPGYYRITVYRGLGQIFRDNIFIGSFRMPKTSHRTELRRVMSHSDASTVTVIKNTDDIFYFEDDFQHDNDMPPEEYWYTFYGDAKGTFENGKMSLSGVGTYLLDVTAENPTLKWDMALALSEVETEQSNSSGGGCEGSGGGTTTVITKSGKIAINVRFRNEYDNMRITYDHSSGKWSLIKTTTSGTQAVAETEKSISPNAEYTYILDVKKDMLTFTCDGEKIFDGVMIDYYGNGKYGFTTYDIGAIIDNIGYAGNGKVNTGVNYKFWPTDALAGTVEFFKGNEENEVGVYCVDKVYTTKDLGETWGDNVFESYSNLANNMITLRSGRKLNVSDWSGFSHASLYEADGTAVKTNVYLQNTDDYISGRYSLQGRLNQGTKIYGNATEPRVYYVTLEGSEHKGVTRVYFSDDEGLSWTESRSDMSYEALGDFYAGEADIIELPDGTVRVWVRCDRGYLYYFDSFDGGLNFDMTPVASQFMSPSTAFSIDRDPENPNTYYMIWTYDTSTTSLKYIQQPRNRESFAVSYDGCKTWEYIMETDDRGIYQSTAFCNASLRIIDGIVYANHGYLESGRFKMDENTTINQVIYAFDPQKIKTTKRFSNAHYIVPDFNTIYDEIPTQAVFPKASGYAYVYGENLPALVDADGFVQADVAARAVGAEMTEIQNGIMLVIGDGCVEFSKGSESYKVNGELHSADEICLSEDGNFLNPRVCAEIFGKIYKQTFSAYMLLSKPLNETYCNELESFVTGVSDNLQNCIDDFKTVGSASELKNFFTKYKIVLNLSIDFSDRSFENMYFSYCGLELESINSYEDMMDAIDLIVNAEKHRISGFIDGMNQSAADGDVAAIRMYITETYSDLLSFAVDESRIADIDGLYQKMTGITYSSISDIESVFKAAYQAQLDFESGTSNTVTVSTASGGTSGWANLNGTHFGGISEKVVEKENIITLSAYEGVFDSDKNAVEEPFENGLVYQTAGTFGKNIAHSGAEVNSGEGTVSFGGEKGNFAINGTDYAKSSTMVYFFDIAQEQGTVSGTFSSGYVKQTANFFSGGNSFGKLPEYLKSASRLTYRIELSMNHMTVYVKEYDAPDRLYHCLFNQSVSYISRSNWFVKFETTDAVAEISNLGIYSAVSSVGSETDGYALVDNIYYSADGEEGHTMADLAGSSLCEDGTVTEDGSLKLIESAGTNPPRASVVWSKTNFKGGFDRAEIEMTAMVEDGGNIFLYFLDNTGYRHSNSSFSPRTFNSASTYADCAWKTGQYYDIKLITNPAGYDENGQNRTKASMYVKKSEDSEWICTAQDLVLTGSLARNSLQFALINCHSTAAVYIKELSLKTYAKPKGDYEFLNNTMNMPQGDYIYSFEYMRMDEKTPTVFTIGGADYSQKFTLGQFDISTNDTEYQTADVDITEDKWYTFYGTVKITAESVHPLDKTKTVKNKITMYMRDADGNVTVLFKDLPMLKNSGNNGLRFRINDAIDAGIKLKNIRIYNGKTVDMISTDIQDGKASVVVDFLNDEKMFVQNSTAYAAVYADSVMTGAKSSDVELAVDPFGYRRMTIDEVDFNAIDGAETELKFFLWKDGVPVTTAASK